MVGVCRSLIDWFELSGADMFGPYLVYHEMRKVKVIHEKFKAA